MGDREMVANFYIDNNELGQSTAVESFALGVEWQMYRERLRSAGASIKCCIHVANAGRLTKLSQENGYRSVEIEDHDDGRATIKARRFCVVGEVDDSGRATTDGGTGGDEAERTWTENPPVVNGLYLETGYNRYTGAYRKPAVVELKSGEDLCGELRTVLPITLPIKPRRATDSEGGSDGDV